MTTKKGLAVRAEMECLAQPTAIKVADLAQRWDICRSTITRMINDGSLPAFPVGRTKSGKPHFRVLLSAVLSIEAQAEAPTEPEPIKPWRGKTRRAGAAAPKRQHF